MILIGERINAGFKDIANAIKTRAPEPIVKWASLQKEAGADYLDINMGAISKNPDDMVWLVEVAQAAAVDLPLSIDSQRIEIVEAALKACQKPALINSTTAEDDKLYRFIELACTYNASLLGVTMDERGSPNDVERRIELAAKIITSSSEAGLPPERLFIDPIVMPIKYLQAQAQNLLEAIRQIAMLSQPQPHICIGLSNLSSGAQQRSLLNSVFLVMAMACGLDAAICDVCDKQLMASVATAEVILNQQIYSDSYLRAFELRSSKS